MLEELDTLHCGVAVYGCTASSLFKPHEETSGMIADRLGVAAAVVTTMGCVLQALRAVGAKNIAVGAPYPDKFIQAERAFFEKEGFTITADKGILLFD